MFFDEFGKSFKNTFFMKNLQATTSESMTESGCKFNKILEQILKEDS